MTEVNEQSGYDQLEEEIEAVRIAKGYDGLNNFRSILPGGYRYIALERKPNFGNRRDKSSLKGLSLREFVEFANRIREDLGIDQNKVAELQEGLIKSQTDKNL